MNLMGPVAPAEESARPLVASAHSNRSLWLFGIVLAIASVLLFRALESRRETLTAPSIAVPAEGSSGEITAPPQLEIPQAYQPGYDASVTAPPSAPYIAQPSYLPTVVPRTHASAAHANASPASPATAALSPPPAPATQDIIAAQTPYQPATPPSVPLPPAVDGSASSSNGKERVEASRFANPATTVPKGTVIQAVLETALDSNRPGFARAIVSRDVMGFDGSKVLIPRGSRIIGEYKSDVSLGQNRVLIQWQRLMRPDGVVIDIDSPSADPLGRAGVKGKVNSHFFQRFAGSILQSALGIGTQLATREVSHDVYIGLPGVTQGMIVQPEKIQPTVKVRQGSSVSVFVARDLDFTKVSS